MDSVTQDVGHLSVGSKCGVKVKEEPHVVFPPQIECMPSAIKIFIDLSDDFLDLGWGDFLQELAAHNKLFVSIYEIGLGIVFLDCVLGQDRKIK